ncbi:MAG TPA: aminopeptidase [Candidatus Dormibacteraeota bacterium]|jgi:aminopeptidase|nr:aminopeptidase [Candidatus Dormibacteraeota bacterium]
MNPAAAAQVLSSPFTPEELTRYGEIAVGACLDLRRGDRVLISYEHEHRPLAVAIAEAAFRRGLIVDTHVHDPLIRRAEIELAPDETLGAFTPWGRGRFLARTEEDTVGIYIRGESLPGILDGCDPKRVRRQVQRQAAEVPELFERVRAKRDSFLILGYPTRAWAERVYPELAGENAVRRLAEDLLGFCRIGPEDGEGGDALDQHISRLQARADAATARDLRRLHFEGPGTDLWLGLTDDCQWLCARTENAFGRRHFVNLPSEEIFTSPAASATEGTVRCTLPLSRNGVLFEDISLEFRGGRLERLEARTDRQREALLAQLDIDEGGRHLGEVALVDERSRVGRTGRQYWNTLLDENQASHIALGVGFASSRGRGEDSPDLNQSKTHIDVMIGSAEVNMTAETASGETLPLIVDGRWQLPD